MRRFILGISPLSFVFGVFVFGFCLPASGIAGQQETSEEENVAQVDSIKDQTIGIMSFANVNGTEASEWIGSGITETLMSDLNIRLGLTVVDLGALSQALGSDNVGDGSVINDVSALELSRAMEANWLITGSYELMDNELLITARLYVVDTGVILKTVRVNGVVNEIFTLQDQVVALFETQLRSNDVPLSAIARNESVPPDLSQSSVVQSSDTESKVQKTISLDAAVAIVTGKALPIDQTEDIPLSTENRRVSAVDPNVAIPIRLPTGYSGPPIPVLPNVISRDESDGVVIRAVRVSTPLRIDGILNEEVYENLIPASDFIQLEPYPGLPATEKTDVWVLFDDDNVYVSFRCWETQPDQLVANDMRRDNPMSYTSNNSVGFAFDSFGDRRNGNIFTVNAIGGVNDGQTTDERQYNGDWNPVWDSSVELFEGGWAIEVAIPFRSLRYRQGQSQIWGFNVSRNNPSKSEWSYLSQIPASRTGPMGLMQVSFAATLVGMEVPSGSMNLEVKPYAISETATDMRSTPSYSNDISANAGVDIKYGITQNLTADFTYNTDFAQVEVDEQQVNLTRFSLYFPEKREFFLENQGMFSFGGTATSGPGAFATDAPVLFYSRRIGLEQGRAVPVEFGGRLSGRLGRFSLGLLSIRTNEERRPLWEPDKPENNELLSATPLTNFSVMRLKADIFRRSSIGMIFTGRSNSGQNTGSNEAYGMDAALAFFDNLSINAFWARTKTDGASGDETSYRAQLDYSGDRYGVQVDHILIGDDFNPAVGFLRRSDMRRSFAEFRFSPRPSTIEAVRKFSWLGSMAYIENMTGLVEGRELKGQFAIEFLNTDELNVSYDSVYEFLPRPFAIARNVTLPVRGYDFWTARVGWTFGMSRSIFGNLAIEQGTFYSGRKTAVSFGRARAEVTSQLSVEPNLSLNWIDLKEGKFQATVIGSRFIYSLTPLMFVSGLVQYNSASRTVGTNIRLRWEYAPGSELFVVYNDQRDSITPRFPGLMNRAIIIKINRLFRF